MSPLSHLPFSLRPSGFCPHHSSATASQGHPRLPCSVIQRPLPDLILTLEAGDTALGPTPLETCPSGSRTPESPAFLPTALVMLSFLETATFPSSLSDPWASQVRRGARNRAPITPKAACLAKTPGNVLSHPRASVLCFDTSWCCDSCRSEPDTPFRVCIYNPPFEKLSQHLDICFFHLSPRKSVSSRDTDKLEGMGEAADWSEKRVP